MAKTKQRLQDGNTERKRAEEALRESEERLRAVVSNAPIILFALDRDGIVGLCDGKGLKGLGLRPGEAIGRSFFDLFPDFTDVAKEALRRVLAGKGFTATTESAGRTFETHCSPLRDRDEQVSGLIGVNLDISERKQAEEALRESEERLRAVVHNAPIVLFALNRDGVFTLAEGKGLEALGLKPGELVGLSTFDVHGHLPQITEDFQRALAGEAFTRTTQLNGQTFEARCAPIRDQNGEISGVIGVAIDVTERKRMEEALHMSEERLRLLASNVPIMLFAIDRDGTFTLADGKGLEDIGRKPGERVGRSIFAEFPDVPDIRKKFDRALRGETSTFTVEVGGRTFDAHCAPTRQQDGESSGIIGFAVDVTEREQMEEALRESEAKYRQIFENVQDIYYRTDVQSNVVEVSPSAQRYGYAREELIGTSILRLLDRPEDQSKLRKVLLERGEVTDHEMHLKAADGRVINASVNAHLLHGPDGAIVGFEGSVRDVTERKRAEEALRESEEHLRLLVSNAPVTLFALDRDGVFTLSEGKGLEAVGLKPGEQVGQSLLDRFPNLPGIREGLDRLLAGEPATLTVELNGRAIEVHCSPTRGQDGEVSGVIGVALNVTERKRAEEALRASEETYRAIFNATNDSIVVHDMETGQIVDANAAFLERHGCTTEDTRQLNVVPAGPGEAPYTPEDALRWIRKAARGQPQRFEWLSEDGDGRHIWLDMTLKRATIAGQDRVLAISRDITERKQAEEALSESEAKYRQIFENVQDIYYRTDAQGTITEVSPSVQRFGYTRAELIGTPVLTIYESLEEPPALLEVILERGEVTDYEIGVKAADGRVINASLSAHLLRGPGGTLVGFEGSVRDISERKRAEEALRESEEKFRRIFDNVQDIYYRTDAQGIITDISPSVQQFGYTPEALIGTPVLDVYESPEERSALLQALFERGVIVDYEIHLKTGHGDVRSTSVSTQLLRGPDGAFAGVEGSLRDITERKRMEQALRESEAKYRHIFENVQDIYYRTDAQGIITEINPSIERYGYTRDGLIGTQVLNVYESQEERAALLKALFESEAVVDYEIHLRTGDGRVIETSASTHLLRGSDGEFVGVEGSLRDITERKRMEKALREQVRRDPLTGALNHGAIVEELKTLIASGGDGSSHAVAMIDVDGLKAINDTYGHQVGDAVLVTVADALSRDGAVVGRYGGDEFVALLPGADRDAAESYRQQVLAVLAEANLRDSETGSRVPIVASVGLAIYPTEAGRIEELIKLADSAMYEWRRQRPVAPTASALSRPMGGERAAKMVGEIVPLLTSPGDLNDKLRLVAHRLSVGTGYDAVNFQVFEQPSNVAGTQNTVARLPDELIEAWDRAQREAADAPIRAILERTHRPVIIDDPQHDERLTDEQQQLLRAAGLRSALVAPMIWRNEVIGTLSVASKRKAAFGPNDAQFLMAVATQVTAIARMATLVDELQSASTRLVQGHTETVVLLAAAAEAHDQATGLHLRSVRTITEALALELGYSEDYAEELGLAAVLHDIGKIRVPDVVLSTAGALTDEEWELMKQHTAWGQDFLSERPGFELAATIARSHHERWDGSGYPDGLAGTSIPKAASIVSVADSFDAMTSDRPYKAARSVAAAVREIVACSGAQFSPKVVQALVRLHRQKRLARLHREALEDLAA